MEWAGGGSGEGTRAGGGGGGSGRARDVKSQLWLPQMKQMKAPVYINGS